MSENQVDLYRLRKIDDYMSQISTSGVIAGFQERNKTTIEKIVLGCDMEVALENSDNIVIDVNLYTGPGIVVTILANKLGAEIQHSLDMVERYELSQNPVGESSQTIRLICL